jgi:nicotinamide riboside kinase
MPFDTSIPNIYIIGPQSTGKTTLINRLQSDLEQWLADIPIEKPQIVSEVARTVLSKHKFTAKDITSSPNRCLALQNLILQSQAAAENDALQASSWFISDRSGFDPLVYARKYVSQEAMLEMQQQSCWVEVRKRMMSSLVIVCEAGTPWLMDDGVRLMPDSAEAWMQLSSEFCELLDQVGIAYVVIPRTMLGLSDRSDFVRTEWISLFQAALDQTADQGTNRIVNPTKELRST